jgi:hypothetical protein
LHYITHLGERLARGAVLPDFVGLREHEEAKAAVAGLGAVAHPEELGETRSQRARIAAIAARPASGARGTHRSEPETPWGRAIDPDPTARRRRFSLQHGRATPARRGNLLFCEREAISGRGASSRRASRIAAPSRPSGFHDDQYLGAGGRRGHTTHTADDDDTRARRRRRPKARPKARPDHTREMEMRGEALERRAKPEAAVAATAAVAKAAVGEATERACASSSLISGGLGEGGAW